MFRYAVACCAILSIFAFPAGAAVTETASTRYIIGASQGGVVVDGPTQHNGPVLYGPFDDYVETFAYDPIHGGSSQAFQDTTLAPAHYAGYLSARTDAGGGEMGTEIATGYAESYYEVRFTLTTATDFHLTGTYNAFGAINGAVSVSEIRIDNVGGGGSPSQVIATTTNDCCPSYNVSGTLLAGSYALKVVALAAVDHSFMTSYTDSNAEANFNMVLDVPVTVMPGDLNCSGAVDAGDIGPFIQALIDPAGYDAAHPSCNKDLADVNNDTARDGRDIAQFARCVIAGGCP